MKNPLIQFLSCKHVYLTPKGRIEFLIEIIRRATLLGAERINKQKMIDSISQEKSSRFNRGMIYEERNFFGVKYRSFIKCEDFYQIPLLKLGQHTLDVAGKNNLLSIEYIHALNILMSNLRYSLKNAQCIEEEEVLLSW